MKRQEIRDAVAAHLTELGFETQTWSWRAAKLSINVGGMVRHISLYAGISRRGLQFELGRISGWVDCIPDLVPLQQNTLHIVAKAA